MRLLYKYILCAFHLFSFTILTAKTNIYLKNKNDTMICKSVSCIENVKIDKYSNTIIKLIGYYKINDLPKPLYYHWENENINRVNGGSILKSNYYKIGRFINKIDTLNVANFGIFPNNKKITKKISELAEIASKLKVPLQFNAGTYYIQSDLIFENDKTPNNLNKKGFVIPSNSNIINDKETIFKSIANSASNYSIITLHYVNNVTINSLNIIGDRDSHLNQNGEWGHGLFIVGSTIINIKTINVSNCWGDGIIFSGDGEMSGGNKGAINSKINIGYIYSNNNRRQGLTFSNAYDINIDNIKIENTKGILPECGIDFEPDYPYDILQKIKIKNVETRNNNNSGIIFSLQALNSKSPVIDVNIINFSSYNERSFFIGGSLTEYIRGNININYINSYNAPIAGIEIRNYFNQPNLNFGNIVIENPNQDNRSDFYGSAILIYKDLDDKTIDTNKIVPTIQFNKIFIMDKKLINNKNKGVVIQNRNTINSKYQNVKINELIIN